MCQKVTLHTILCVGMVVTSNTDKFKFRIWSKDMRTSCAVMKKVRLGNTKTAMYTSDVI